MAGVIGLLPTAPADLAGARVGSETEAVDRGLPLVLGLFDGRQGLRAPGGRERPLSVDFLEGRQGYRLAAERVRHERLLKAMGPPEPDSEVLDLTAGLGRDALVLARAGYRVVMFERSPFIHALLADGLARLEAGHPQLAARLRLVGADARGALGEAAGAFRCHGVLLDPMFPERDRSAAVKKELQWLQWLAAPPDADEERELLALARGHADKRVVVKRPMRAPVLAGVRPAFALHGRSVRFDVYLPG